MRIPSQLCPIGVGVFGSREVVVGSCAAKGFSTSACGDQRLGSGVAGRGGRTVAFGTVCLTHRPSRAVLRPSCLSSLLRRRATGP